MILDTICRIGRKNLSMKEIADSLGISYSYLMRRKVEIAHNNGYQTFIGFLCEYVRENKIAHHF